VGFPQDVKAAAQLDELWVDLACEQSHRRGDVGGRSGGAAKSAHVRANEEEKGEEVKRGNGEVKTSARREKKEERRGKTGERREKREERKDIYREERRGKREDRRQKREERGEKREEGRERREEAGVKREERREKREKRFAICKASKTECHIISPSWDNGDSTGVPRIRSNSVGRGLITSKGNIMTGHGSDLARGGILSMNEQGSTRTSTWCW
jgi:hypothetical protein